MRFVAKPVEPVERAFDVLELREDEIRIIAFALEKHRLYFPEAPGTKELERRFRHFRDSEGLRPHGMKGAFTD
jgi:hypothetical protein